MPSIDQGVPKESLIRGTEQRVEQRIAEAEKLLKPLCVPGDWRWLTGDLDPETRARFFDWQRKNSQADWEKAHLLSRFIVQMKLVLQKVREGDHLMALWVASMWLKVEGHPGKQPTFPRSVLQGFANWVRSDNPNLSRREVGRRLSPLIGLSDETIRRKIH